MTTKTLGLRAPATLALIVALLALPFAVGTAASSPSKSSEAKPTIVLVHGAWADSSGWNESIEKLQKKGYTALAVATPLRSLHGDAAYLRSVLASLSGPIVLVGHSYGGAVLTNAATGNPNVKALVYIAAFAPDKGETQIELILKNEGSQISPATLTVRPYPGVDSTATSLRACSGRSSLTTSLRRRQPSWPRPSGRSNSRSSRKSRASRPGRTSHRGISSRPRTARSRPSPSASWLSGPVRRSPKSAPRTYR